MRNVRSGRATCSVLDNLDIRCFCDQWDLDPMEKSIRVSRRCRDHTLKILPNANLPFSKVTSLLFCHSYQCGALLHFY
jgi:hypothetical protein